MNKPDWEAIETAYRAGLLSIREIASQHELSDTAIRKKAKKECWVRDLAKKIKQTADEKVRIKEVRAEVRAESKIKERELVEANAEVIANLRISQRKDIRKARDVANNLMAEVDLMDGDIMKRVSTFKSLTEAMKNVIGLERQAYDLDNHAEESTKSKPVVIELVAP